MPDGGVAAVPGVAGARWTAGAVGALAELGVVAVGVGLEIVGAAAVGGAGCAGAGGTGLAAVGGAALSLMLPDVSAAAMAR